MAKWNIGVPLTAEHKVAIGAGVRRAWQRPNCAARSANGKRGIIWTTEMVATLVSCRNCAKPIGLNATAAKIGISNKTLIKYL